MIVQRNITFLTAVLCYIEKGETFESKWYEVQSSGVLDRAKILLNTWVGLRRCSCTACLAQQDYAISQAQIAVRQYLDYTGVDRRNRLHYDIALKIYDTFLNQPAPDPTSPWANKLMSTRKQRRAAVK